MWSYIFPGEYPLTPLKDKSWAVIIVECSRDFTVVNSTFFNFFSFISVKPVSVKPAISKNQRFQSAKKCKMTSFYMISLNVDLNEAAKFVDIIPLTLLASSLHLCTLVQNAKWFTIFGLTYEDSSTNL